MGQHRTREQKERAVQRRTQVISGGYSLPADVLIKTPKVSLEKQRVVDESIAYFKQDMRKTFVVCLVILGIIAALWFKLHN